MTYQVIVTEKAKGDLRHYYSVAAEHAPDTAARWTMDKAMEEDLYE